MSKTPGLSGEVIHLKLLELAQAVEEVLIEQTGKVPTLVLVVRIDDTMQYVSNVLRPEGLKLLDELFEAWQAGLGEVTYHGRSKQRDPKP